ncbi:putative helicase MOV-10 [Saccostrea echinata]|uniref:putative helicase MOV-10 n=1 Tax=Saccostrea echinata TaxID=191078 RepID=UPI002A80A4C4|nr:putative helicase MOV-10 [Saccostrea echinata]
MASPRRVTFAEKKHQGLDFLDYLKDNEINFVGKTKRELQTVYIDKYIPSDSNKCNKNLAFGPVIQTLFTTGRLHLRGIHIHKGPAAPPYLNSHKKKDKQNENQNNNSDPNAGRFYKRTPPRRIGQVAVNQHVVINRSFTPTPVTSRTSSPAPDFPNRSQASNQRRESQPSMDTENIKRIGNYYECMICGARSTSVAEMGRHSQGRRHRLGVVTSEMKKQRDYLIKDREGIAIIGDNADYLNGTYHMQIKENIEKTMFLKLENQTEEMVELLHCEMLKRMRVFKLDDVKKVTEGQGAVPLIPGSHYIIKVHACARGLGTFHVPIAFHLRRLSGKEFHIIRYLNAKCVSDITEQLKPTTPYKPPTRVAEYQESLETVQGLKPPKLTEDNLKRMMPLGNYTVSRQMRTMINRRFKTSLCSNQAEKLEMSATRKILENPLTRNTYQKKFHALMNIEELQMQVDIRRYDMNDSPMTKCSHNKRLLMLEVPGLAENRPSVLKGDHLYVRMPGNGRKEYQGYVHEVHQREVALGFHDSLVSNFVNKTKFNVRFSFNRLPLKLQYRACELAMEEGLEPLLFPTPSNICRRGLYQLPNKRKFFDRKIESNQEQQLAVTNIVTGTSRPAPYIVFGPPGTGKTVTIVEALLQIYYYQPKAHILACAPSNNAADLLAERILGSSIVTRRHLLRLNAYSRHWLSVPEKIRDCCNFNKRSSQYFYPTVEDLMKYRVIITTLVTAGRLASANFPAGHFSHVFIDESGQAIEPEALIAIAGILTVDPGLNCGQLVLAGDPQQLGPILRSPIAQQYGLGTSLLERYMNEVQVYKRRDDEDDPDHHYDNRLITKLLRNYRSHPVILNYPNETFYNGELVPNADENIRTSLCDWEELPTKNFPIIFHGVVGKDQREERSPSFFNPEEAAVVFSYVRKLLTEKRRGLRIQQKQIGIITPYRKQVQKIRQLVHNKGNFGEVDIGSVEEFQGQERLIIIVSTVRSNPEYLSLDLNYNLGFLRNPKRLNVTLTRAKALLIVIGDPNTLSQDQYWKGFIDFCIANKAYTGVDFAGDEEMVEDIMQRLNNININTSLLDEDDDDDDDPGDELIKASEHDEKEWRKEI